MKMSKLTAGNQFVLGFNLFAVIVESIPLLNNFIGNMLPFDLLHSGSKTDYPDPDLPFRVQLKSPTDVFVETSMEIFRKARMDSAYLYFIDSQQGYCKSLLPCLKPHLLNMLHDTPCKNKYSYQS